METTETTKTAVEKTVVKKTIPTVGFDDTKLFKLLVNVDMSTFAEITMVTDPTMRKTNNSFFGRVEKLSVSNINFCGIYKKAVEKKMEKAGIEGSFETAP